MDDFDSRPIVVGVDGSAASHAALRWAVDEAGRRGCAIDAILAWQGGYGMMIGAVTPDLLAESTPEREHDRWRRVLDDAVADVDAGGGIRMVLVTQDAGPALVEASKDAALLVVGTHGAGPVRSALLGSVSAHCVRHSTCPVVVVREPSPRKDRSAAVGSGALATPGPLL
ncbi:universal stress protein [Umezawaea sp. Da 62-37]|uniref:universal stress protein n=1 Tax=Umezawaea sp. Da 62-37 TaxID=3075927 RepID=UPI0028F6EDDC|nr:universal stress protein [Umezawaea sp. Da 62-37]WNV84800.1 universal stress protein [Umezawaea sp. Da 62-37]